MADRSLIVLVAALLLVLAIVVFIVALGDYLFPVPAHPGAVRSVHQIRPGLVLGVGILAPGAGACQGDRRIGDRGAAIGIVAADCSAITIGRIRAFSERRLGGVGAKNVPTF
jgi:hypothetical protein